MLRPARIDGGVRHLREFSHTAEFGPLARARFRSIARQREVAVGRVVVLEVPPEDPAKVDLVQHDHVIEALPAERADEPLRVRILPRGPRRRAAVGFAVTLKCSTRRR